MYQQTKPILEGQNTFGIKRISDNAYIPFDFNNPQFKEYLLWVAEGNKPEPADEVPIDTKLQGFEFEGVNCSATKEDQNNVIAVLNSYQLQKENFPKIKFTFANGQVLIIHKNNVADFLAAFLSFRQSFFLVK